MENRDDVTIVTDVTGKTQRLCIFCEHLHWEYTPGDIWGCEQVGSIICRKKHWDLHAMNDEFLTDYRAKITVAQTCPDYEQVKP